MEKGTLVRLGAEKRIGLVIGSLTVRDSVQFHRTTAYTVCRVRWPDGQEDDCPASCLKPVLCTYCGYDIQAHTEEGKCLYGPGNWEVS